MDRFVFSTTRRKRRADHGGAVEVEEGEASAHHEGPDLISLLPDCVLGEIVSLLDTEEGARTAVLSRRWRYIWRSAPRNLDDRLRFIYPDRERLQVISQIIDAHPGPVRRLAVRSFISSYVRRYNDWFPLPMFDALQDLVLHFPYTPDRLHRMPATALRFSCLRVLDIDNCTFSAIGFLPAFPCLTYLSLSAASASPRSSSMA
ncbi:hypothetical protein PAHAL_7G265800 [Panicum hallii]|jgi:hypothetical protein|uniref:F-box domain-containing protein n=1 Tax=Panicum hallii TaxID=206008 RepID=A0A2T8IDM6_9POAL|nr:hypothetical protein PAHAL_7G265800 [Panicum hallii]